MEFKRGEIYFAYIIGTGSVQNGMRPVVIIQNDIGNKYSPTLLVACITTRKQEKEMPTHVTISKNFGLPNDSKVLAEQIQTINKSDIKGGLICKCPEEVMQMVDKALKISLQLKDQPKEGYINKIVNKIETATSKTYRDEWVSLLQSYCFDYGVDYRVYLQNVKDESSNIITLRRRAVVC